MRIEDENLLILSRFAFTITSMITFNIKLPTYCKFQQNGTGNNNNTEQQTGIGDDIAL